jgi:beta-fructofuranosidase
VTTAASHDGGHTWTKRPEPLIPQPPTGTTMYRDPYVWRQHDRWRMLVGAALDDGRGAALLYESHDLTTWEYHGPFLTSRPGTAGDGNATATGWECPQYATFGDHGVLIVSDWDPQHWPRGVIVCCGKEEHGRFTASTPALLDHGPDFYAPALLRAPDNRWLLWAWAWEARDPDWAGEAGWAGVLTHTHTRWA